jgi:SAM-dependent methyltransferase
MGALTRARTGWRNVLRAANTARYTAYHYVDAIAPRGDVSSALRGYPRYLRDRRRYEDLSGERLSRYDDDPQLRDWTESSPFDPHYTYQDAWAAREIHADGPARHVDVGSRISYVMGLTAFVPVVFVDLRPLAVTFPGLESVEGTLMALPFEDASVESISCLHVAEHIGLGRYGDPLDPHGTEKAARELARVVAPGGRLYFSLPVGRPRTAFNAHRVHDPRSIPTLFPELRLDAFAGVDDARRFHERLETADLAGSDWACGFYRFTRDPEDG